MKKFIFLLLLAAFASPARGESARENTYDRVMKSQTIRCGYFSWYPASLKDVKTGEIKGIFPDYMAALGKILNLKIEWVEEIGLGDYPAALESGRIDAMCGIWQTAARGRVVDFPLPIYYQPLMGFSRTGDTRFDKDIQAANSPDYTMAVLEGGVTSTLRSQRFPLSKPLELPQLTSPAELFVSLEQGKADMIIYDLFTYEDYNKQNPGKIRPVSHDPIKIFPNSIAVMRGQEEFRRMIDHATTELLLSGTIDAILDQYNQHPGSLVRVAAPFETGKQP